MREDAVLEQIEDVFQQLQLSPEAIEKITKYIRNGAEYERDYYKIQMEALYKEQTRMKNRLDKLMDFWLEGKITEEEHSEKRKSLAERCDMITFEIAKHANADDKFSERMQDIVKMSGKAHSHFQLSKEEGKRRLINLVFSTIKLRGRTLEFTMRPPFDHFIKIDEMDKWPGAVIRNMLAPSSPSQCEYVHVLNPLK